MYQSQLPIILEMNKKGRLVAKVDPKVIEDYTHQRLNECFDGAVKQQEEKRNPQVGTTVYVMDMYIDGKKFGVTVSIIPQKMIPMFKT